MGDQPKQPEVPGAPEIIDPKWCFEMIEALFGEDFHKEVLKPGQTLDIMKKYFEDFIKADPAFGEKVQNMINTRNLLKDPADETKFKTWLQERLANVEKTAPEAAKPSVPINVAGQPPAAPTGPGARTDQEAPTKEVAPTGQVPAPTEEAPKEGEEPAPTEEAPKEGEKKELTPEQEAKKKKFQEFVKGLMEIPKLSIIKLGERVAKLMAYFAKLTKGGFKMEDFLKSPRQKKLEKALDNLPPVTVEQIDAVTDIQSPSRSVEFVWKVLGLHKLGIEMPKDAAELLKDLAISGRVLKKEPLSDLEVGDLVFFNQADDPSKAYKVAIVRETKPQVVIKTIPTGGGQPINEPLKSSGLFMGFVKLAKKKPEEKQPEQPKPADKSQQPKT